MSLTKDIIKEDIINNDNLLEKIINIWNGKYTKKLQKLSNKVGLRRYSVNTSDSESEISNKTCDDREMVGKLLREAIKCKAYAETEYKAIKIIRSELEDCQMIKELGLSLRKSEEEKSEQSLKLKTLNGKNLELMQENQNLEKSLLELSLRAKSTHITGNASPHGDNDKKSTLAVKLEAYTNRTQTSIRPNKMPDYCRIAPSVNLFSDSELSVSEEDSLEKDVNDCDTLKKSVLSPTKFASGVKQVSQSTPVKNNFSSKSIGTTNGSHQMNVISNLTQDLKDLQKYFNKKDDDPVNAPTYIFDWEMSQISFDDTKDHSSNGLLLEAKEEPDEGLTSVHQFTKNDLELQMDQLTTDLCIEKEKYQHLSSLVLDLYTLVHIGVKKSVSLDGTNDVPTGAGDRPSTDTEQDPLHLLHTIKTTLDTKLRNQTEENTVLSDGKRDKDNFNIDNLMDGSHKFNEENGHENIFQTLSETSVRLLAEIITKIAKVNQTLCQRSLSIRQNDTKDYTPLVTEYLQYLMSRESVDFENSLCRKHPIYDMLVQLEVNVHRIFDKQIVEDKENGLSQSLENFYQEQLNKCYDDINRLKQQLESAQQVLTNKLPLDASQALFEAKQKLQNELESVDREYARQMARERKRLEESECIYNELLTEHEMMQQKYSANIIALNQQIEQLERKIEADRRFIDQQQFEWELERTQHNADIEHLNKSIGQIKKSSSFSENISNSPEYESKDKFQKSNSAPKYKYRSLSSESQEVFFNETASQTMNIPILILKSDLLLEDLEQYDEFMELREDIKKNQNILLNFIHEFCSMIFDLMDNNDIELSLDNLHELNTKVISDCFHHTSLDCLDIRYEILNIRDYFTNSLQDQIHLKKTLERVQEELEINSTNNSMKQEMITALEEEIQSLMEFQRNLSKDYDLLQTMLEDKQNELDKLSAKLVSEETINDYEEQILKLKKELNEKQNVVDERDEDLYVLKEEKEAMEKDLQLLTDKYESTITQQNDIYKDLEKELKDSQLTNRELQKQLEDQTDTIHKKLQEMQNFERLQNTLMKEIEELNYKNEVLFKNNANLMEENQLTELRLSEINNQHKLEIGKLNTSLDEMEAINRKIVDESQSKKVTLVETTCQTHPIDDDVGKESLKNFVNIQDKLIKSIDSLRKKYNTEKELKSEIETKYKHLSTKYETLSNKVLILGDKVNDNRNNKAQNIDNNMDQSLDSTDINDVLNESQISIDEDTEFQKVLQECLAIEHGNDSARPLAIKKDSVDRLEGLNENINTVSDVGSFGLSDWFTDLLKEVEVVLQSCIIGDNIPNDMVVKLNRFRNLLEQMYKKQFSILLNKISSVEHEMQLLCKNNQELKHKSDFIMTELQEKDSTIRNMRLRLDQEISNSTRLVETNRSLLDQNRMIKSDFTSQTAHFKDELDRELNKYSDINRQLKQEQILREKLEAALSIADERIKLVEQSNVELIKKSRQQADYQQKEMDSFNVEYAEIVRRCNNYKIQMESMQQNLQYQTMDCEKTKSELQETIQSNTEYRDKMNEFIKIYQERRKKLETEVNELHQLLQISCRREITLVKDNETLRVKYQSIKSVCKDYEKKLKELKTFISDLHLKHEEDRQEWLNMVNGNIDTKDKDDGILSQINWLLKMLQLRIELLILHYIPTESTDNRTEWNSTQLNSLWKTRPFSADSSMNRSNSELVMLLQSIKSMQTMINLYLNHNRSRGSIVGGKNLYADKLDKHSLAQNNINNRPKPTGSSDSLDSISDTESASDRHETAFRQEMDSINTKIYFMQTNKIIELQLSLDHYEKWRQQLIDQKRYILSQLSHQLAKLIATPLLTEEQKMIIRQNFFKFKFKAVAIAVIAHIRFIRIIQSPGLSVSLASQLHTVGLQLPQPKFSTNPSPPPSQKSSHTPSSSMANKIPKKPVPKSNNITSSKYCESRSISTIKSHKIANESPLSTSDASRNAQLKEVRSNLSPIPSASPPIDRRPNRSVGNNVTSSIPRMANKSAISPSKGSTSTYSYSNAVRKSLPTMSINRKNPSNPNDRNVASKTSHYSITLKQIDDFGKRLDKYTDVAHVI